MVMLALASSANKPIFFFQKVMNVSELLGYIWALLFPHLQNEHEDSFGGKVISHEALAESLVVMC